MITKADINRVARAAEHIKAAITHLDNIKDDHIEGKERIQYNEIYKDLKFELYRLERWINELTS